MEKKAYVKPVMESETFVPNTYIAACGDEHKVYKFVCNAGWHGTLLGYDVYTNGSDGKPGTKDDVYLGGYTPCDATHEASTTDDFIPDICVKIMDWLRGVRLMLLFGVEKMVTISIAPQMLT